MQTSKMLIAVPSYNRPSFKALEWLLKLNKFSWVVCVEPCQLRYYAQTVPRTNLIVSENHCGVGGQVARIGRYAEETGHDYVFKVDDDTYMTDLLPNGKGSGKGRAAERTELHLPYLSETIDRCPNIGAIGFYRFRDFSNHNKRDNPKPFPFGHLNRKIEGMYVTRPEHMRKQTGIFIEDLGLSLEVVSRGQDILYYGWLQQNPIFGVNEGGQQTWGELVRAQRETACVKLLNDRYGAGVVSQERRETDGRIFMVQSAKDVLPSFVLTSSDPVNCLGISKPQ